MLAAIRAVGFTYMASSAGSVGSRRAGLQHDDTIPRTVRDTIRPTLPSSGASAVGRMRSAQAGLWTATAGTGQPAPSVSRPSASRSCAEPDESDRFPVLMLTILFPKRGFPKRVSLSSDPSRQKEQ